MLVPEVAERLKLADECCEYRLGYVRWLAKAGQRTLLMAARLLRLVKMLAACAIAPAGGRSYILESR